MTVKCAAAEPTGDPALFRHPNLLTEGPYPDIVRIHRMPGDKQIVGEDWHTDTTCMAEPPCGAACGPGRRG